MSPQRYQEVSLNDLDHDAEPTPGHNQPTRFHWLRKLPLTPLLLAVLANLSLLIGYRTTIPSAHPSLSPPTPVFGIHSNHSTTCGDTPTTARAANCTFDILTYAWQAPACYDRALVEDFSNLITWEFFTNDVQDPKPLAAEVVLRGEQDVRAYWEFHVSHCRYMFRRLLRAVRVGGVVDGKLGGYGHVCSPFLAL
jgi:hypothetical protein